MDESQSLLAISPLDGRYAKQTQPLMDYFSEFALIRARIRVEVSWFIALAENGLIAGLKGLSAAQLEALDRIWQRFDINDALRVKALEATTNHDVKACEYFVRECFANRNELACLERASAFIHFAATSEDINNLSYGLLLRTFREEKLVPTMGNLVTSLANFARAHADLPMLSRTHGQSASPTTLGKEFAVFAHRLRGAFGEVQALPLPGKMNGAVGNFNAHLAAFPNINWQKLSFDLVQSLGLEPQVLTTQIEPHDGIARFCHAVMRFNSVLLDMNRDIWGYISLGYLKQRRIDTETGSSTMPHKVNPIDFENSEGNLGVANAILGHLAEKLPISRWQRDLSDSTSMRNLGVGVGHSWLAMKSAQRGLEKIEANQESISNDLDGAWEVLAEAAQTLMRREGIADAYEQLKSLTRGERITEESWHELVSSLDLPREASAQLTKLMPSTYIGIARELANRKLPSM